jgi:multidrug resistance efflux pump
MAKESDSECERLHGATDIDCLAHAEADLAKATVELEHATEDVEQAEAEVKKAEANRHQCEIDVKVDGQIKRVKAGVYVVSAFKKLVGVAADRELDVIKDGVLQPLDDNAEIKVHECEIFVSHVRTGGSS